MRVLHLSSGNLYGGVETFLLALAKYRDMCPDMEPHFGLCFEGRLSQELRETGAPTYLLGEVRIRQPWTTLATRSKLRTLLRTRGFDAVVCHSIWPHVVFGRAAKQERTPLALWLHDSIRPEHWLYRWARRTVPRLAICNSRFTAQRLPDLFPSIRHEVVYCPAKLEGADHIGVTRDETRRELGAEPSTTVVIQASRFEEWKGHRALIAALRSLRLPHKWVCWIAGGAQRPTEQRYLREVQSSVRDAGLEHRVRFLGQRMDIPRLLAAADIHCQPNTGPEPFGLTFLEALQAGLPVITTAIGGALEIVDSSCGVLTPAEDLGALTQALERLIAEPEKRTAMGEAGRHRARLFSPETQLPRLHGFLEWAVSA